MNLAKFYHLDLVAIMNETLVTSFPMENYTFDEYREDRVAIAGREDKRGSTNTLTVTLSGRLLPPQHIWDGKSNHCILSCH